MSEAALRLSGVCKAFGRGGPNEVRVLEGVDLEVRAGETVALVAPSGAGKSTLLHIAGLLEAPDSGGVGIGGADMSGLGDRRRTLARRREVGFVYQFHHLLPEFSACENVMLPRMADGAGRGEARERAMELLSIVGVAERADHRPAALSGGERQRVAFCRALANAPKLLLADEPTGNLDAASSERVFGCLEDLVRRAGLAALVATHDLGLAARMDRVVRLEGGTVEPGMPPPHREMRDGH